MLHLCIGAALAAPYDVTTVAGLKGTSGTADGAGTAARFRNPAGIALDGAQGQA